MNILCDASFLTMRTVSFVSGQGGGRDRGQGDRLQTGQGARRGGRQGRRADRRRRRGGRGRQVGMGWTVNFDETVFRTLQKNRIKPDFRDQIPYFLRFFMLDFKKRVSHRQGRGGQAQRPRDVGGPDCRGEGQPRRDRVRRREGARNRGRGWIHQSSFYDLKSDLSRISSNSQRNSGKICKNRFQI